MSRREQIDVILDKRGSLAQKSEKLLQNTQNLNSALQNLFVCHKSVISQIRDDQVVDKLREFDLGQILEEVENELAILSKLIPRFSRQTLNIGVVGHAGHGKSTLLQSLSGLKDDAIPSGSGAHVTGTLCTIHNTPGSEPRGKILYHTEDSFLLEVIAPYYKKLELGKVPESLEEFEDNPPPPLPNRFANFSEFKAMYGHLEEYRTQLYNYRDKLIQSNPDEVVKNKIREYVAQRDADTKQSYYLYRAVKRAEIYCEFPYPDIGKITLIDTPGLGDTGLANTEQLINLLSQDVDIVLFVRLPKLPRYAWDSEDVKLYDQAKSAMMDLPFNLCSFMILNRTTTDSQLNDNWTACEELKDTFHTSHIDVARLILASCADHEQVGKLILDDVLKHMIKHMPSIDLHYSRNIQSRLVRLNERVSAELDKITTAFGTGISKESWYPLFVRLFNKLWMDLNVGLEGLLRELRSQRKVEDDSFKEEQVKAVQACKSQTGIPTINEIEIRRDSEGSFEIAYNKYLHEIRSCLSGHFLGLDFGLKKSLEIIKARVVTILKEKGNLGTLAEANGSDFLLRIAEIIPDELKNLKLGFQILADFELSYRGLIQHRIRKHLDRLTPDETTLKLSKSPSADEIDKCLRALHSEVIYECENALSDLRCEPSEAAYAIVEEFIDRILRAKGVKDDWQVFLEKVRADIWTQEFDQSGENLKLRTEWLTAVKHARIANDPKLIDSIIDAD